MILFTLSLSHSPQLTHRRTVGELKRRCWRGSRLFPPSLFFQKPPPAIFATFFRGKRGENCSLSCFRSWASFVGVPLGKQVLIRSHLQSNGNGDNYFLRREIQQFWKGKLTIFVTFVQTYWIAHMGNGKIDLISISSSNPAPSLLYPDLFTSSRDWKRSSAAGESGEKTKPKSAPK